MTLCFFFVLKHVDIAFYYLRKKACYHPELVKQSFTTADYAFNCKVVRIFSDMKNTKSDFNWEKERNFLNVVNGLEIPCSRPFMEVDFLYIPLLVPAANIGSRRTSSVSSSGNHWCLAVLNIKERYIILYDSFYSPGSSVVADYVSKFCEVLSSAFSYLKVPEYVGNMSKVHILWGSSTTQANR